MHPARILLFCAASMILGACNDPVPDKDLEAAKRSLADAKGAKAEQYDPENFRKAEGEYREALRKVADDENVPARERALRARESADLAALNARRKMAEEAIANAEKALADAEAAKAGFLAADEYARGRAKLADARAKYDAKKYQEAFSDAENAREAAGRARDTAARKDAELARLYADAEASVQRAERDPLVQRYAANEVARARAKLDSAAAHKARVDNAGSIQAGTAEMRNDLAGQAYAQALRDAGEARELAQAALRIALEREREEYRRIASEKMDEARRLMEEVRKLKEQGLIKRPVPEPPPAEDGDSDGEYSDDDTVTDDAATTNDTPAAADDIAQKTNMEKYEAALRALQLAEQNFESREYQDSIEHAEEAIRIARLIRELIEAQKDLKTYVVRYLPRASDCLWRIASYPYIYGDARLWPRIWKANKHLIVDPDLIFPGQKFVIPPR